MEAYSCVVLGGNNRTRFCWDFSPEIIFLRKLLICQNCCYFQEKLTPVLCFMLEKKMEKNFKAVKMKHFKKVK